jgi:hypothetical protein
MRWILWLALALASTGVAANEAKKKPVANPDQAAAARRKQLEIALADVCARHAAVERCFLVIARDGAGRAGLWFVPVFDHQVDPRALGEAQQVWTRLVPGGGQIPMMLLPADRWRDQLKDVVPIHVRGPRK